MNNPNRYSHVTRKIFEVTTDKLKRRIVAAENDLRAIRRRVNVLEKGKEEE